MSPMKSIKNPSPDLPLNINALHLLRGRGDAFLKQGEKCRGHITPDAIHDLRVAGRRLRDCLEALDFTLEPKAREKLMRLVRRNARQTGPLRDCDVARGLVDGILGSSPANSPVTQAARIYLAALASQHPKRLKRASKKLEDFSFGKARRHLDTLCRHLEKQPPAPLSAEIPLHIINSRIEPIRALKRAALNPRNTAAQHELRIALKHLRYSIELLDFCFAPPCQDIRDMIRAFQDELGILHDTDVLIARIEAWLEKPRNSDAPADAFAALLEHLRQNREMLHDHFAKAFRPVRCASIQQGLIKSLRI